MAVVAWIFLSAVGLLFATVDTIGAYNRWQLAKVAVPEDTRLIDLARSTTMAQAAHVALFVLFLAIGLVAATDINWLFPSLMFAANIVLVVSTVREHRFRRRMYTD